MILSDKTIRELLVSGDMRITPEPKDVQFQPVSVDLTLGTTFCRMGREPGAVNRWTSPQLQVRPGGFVLAATQERISLPAHLVGFVHGKSTLARRGLMVEAAGLVDPGFDGTITLELKNLSHLPLTLPAGTAVCQLTVHAVDAAVLRPYGSAGLNSRYQGQTDATPAR